MTFLRGFVKMAGGRMAGGWEWECVACADKTLAFTQNIPVCLRMC